jgi:hypothetical protein
LLFFFYGRNKRHSFSEQILGTTRLRNLTTFEKEFFDVNLDKVVLEGYKFNKAYQVFHSIKYRTGSKTNSYVVKYFFEESLYYAIINYFINFNNQYYACIFRLIETEDDFMFNNRTRVSDKIESLKKNGIFNSEFCIVKKTNEKSFIKCCQILTKCILVPVNGIKNYFYASDFITNNEHD